MKERIIKLGTSMTSSLRMLPWYFIIGAKRSGTTSVQEYLSAHPAVLAPRGGKGTRYFDINYTKGEHWFRAHFPVVATARFRTTARSQAIITGDASPYYCFHPLAIDRIADLLPEARLIFILRDPVERAYSQWVHETAHGFEHLDIHNALDAEEERLAGEEDRLVADPRYVSFPHRHHAYVRRGHYVDQLERVHKRFPSEQVLICRFEEMFRDPAVGMARVQKFLGLPLHRLARFPAYNSARRLEMPGDVRTRLSAYYAPHNDRLRRYLGAHFPST